MTFKSYRKESAFIQVLSYNLHAARSTYYLHQPAVKFPTVLCRTAVEQQRCPICGSHESYHDSICPILILILSLVYQYVHGIST